MKKWLKKIFLGPWIWIWQNIKDWRTAVIFGIVFLVVSSEVWVPYIIGWFAFRAGNTALGTTMTTVASTCWLFWIGPGTPFLPLCIGITAGIKALLNKIFKKHGGM